MRRLFFELRYLLGRAPWDTGISPPELLALLNELPPGRAIDLGCGTGTNVATLLQHGWQVVGVDFSPRGITLARRRLRSLALSAHLILGDVTRLDGIAGPFDLALDIGCFHALGPEGQVRYVESLATRLRPGGCYLIYAIVRGPEGSTEGRPTQDEILRAFEHHFTLQSTDLGDDRGRTSIWMRWQRRG
jgi:cyclopropane fatty-acyl-phospholipid synthase-like methyltransferase